MRLRLQGYLAKIRESPKLVIKKKRPSSQIPFFTYKPLAEFGFEARQIRIIRTHPNSPGSPNSVIRVTIWLFGYLGVFGYSCDPNNRIFGYSVIRVTPRKLKKPNLAINLEVR
jgi:hypothetical protein